MLERSRILTPATLAREVGWPTQRMRRFLAREGALVKHGSRYYTTPTAIRNHYPQEFQELQFELGDDREC